MSDINSRFIFNYEIIGYVDALPIAMIVDVVERLHTKLTRICT